MDQNNTSATVAIMSFNDHHNLIRLVDTLQEMEFPGKYEILVIDNSLDAETKRVVRKLEGIRLIEIDNKDFNHGATRDLAAQESKSKYMAFITQDALPAGRDWLTNLIAPMEDNADIVCVFGKQEPYADCNPIVKAWMYNSYSKLSPNGKVQIHSLEDKTKEGTYFNSDVNAAYSREFLLKHPFGEVAYAEDQLMAKQIIDGGFQKAYSPDAIVFHSHSWNDPYEYFQRIFDEHRGLKQVLNYVVGEVTLGKLPIKILASTFRDIKNIWTKFGDNLWQKIYWSMLALPIDYYQNLGVLLGSRYDEIHISTNYLSREDMQRRQKQMKLNLWQKFVANLQIWFVLLTFASTIFTRRLAVVHYYAQNLGWSQALQTVFKHGFDDPRLQSENYDFIKNKNTDEKIKFEKIKNKKISWILPPFVKGSGGHTTIFRFMKVLEDMGYKNNIYIFRPFYFPEAGLVEILINKHFQNFKNLSVSYLDEKNPKIVDSEVLFLTDWRSAYLGYGIANVGEKIYFIQDFEPMFYDDEDLSRQAEQTYHMGYKYIAVSRWLDSLMGNKYKMAGDFVELGYDPSKYKSSTEFSKRQKTICFYARSSTKRRGTDLGLKALKILNQQHPEVKIKIFGDNNLNVDFPAENLGILSHPDLNELYNNSQIGVVFSLSNYSLIPQEMNAAGLPVMDIKWEGNQINYKGREGVKLVEKDAEKIAMELGKLIDSPKVLQEMHFAALADAEKFNWEKSFKKFKSIFESLTK